jgi:hypothetical protein
MKGKSKYEELLSTVEQAKSSIARQKDDNGPTSNCSLIVIGGQSTCSGSCGWINWFLGRTCQLAGATTDQGVETYCVCYGGWFDNTFR